MIDFKTLQLNWKPNQFLLLPDNFDGASEPHARSPRFMEDLDSLFARLKRVAMAELRVEIAEENQTEHYFDFIQRSKRLNFPDVISAKAFSVPSGGSALAIYSRSKVGIGDFGVNKARVNRWVAALQAGY